MSNCFTASGVDESVQMSNGLTSVLCDVVALAGSSVAVSPWEQRLVLLFCDSERVSTGLSGFDLAEVPWTGEWVGEQAFFVRIMDLAVGRYGWDRLCYDPGAVGSSLLAYRRMVAAFRPAPVSGSWLGDWGAAPSSDDVLLCARHGVFEGAFGCRLCDASVQPG